MKKRALFLQRAIQTLSLLLFLWLLFMTAWPLSDGILPPDLYLRLDPLIAIAVPLAAREWIATLAPGLLLVMLTIAVGRVFCGYICPMGITLDLFHRIGRVFMPGQTREPALKPHPAPWMPRLKYLFLTVVLVSAALGVNNAWLGSPISLITRFYALLLHPVVLLLGDSMTSPLQSVASLTGLTSLSYIDIQPRRFDSLYFILGFFALLFQLELVRPRFWCRYLCPAGAALGLASTLPLWRRRVRKCANCGQCARSCPTAAISTDGLTTLHAECITCRACVDVCPRRETSFSLSGQEKPAAIPPPASAENGLPQSHIPSRRAFAGAAATGALLSAVQYSGAHSLLRLGNRGNLWSDALIRPPGSVPEPQFLDRCIRCGECMKVCPTNALQPALLTAGAEGLFSPLLTPRRGPCEPECNACGRVCPTRAIRSLPLEQKKWAKVGTAVVLQHRCLAWAEGRRCMVCEEVCPYGSVKVIQVQGSKVPAPVVNDLRCYGCGYCEQYCPVRVPAIQVQPLNAIRLDHADYAGTARSMGLELSTEKAEADFVPDGSLPPGFSD